MNIDTALALCEQIECGPTLCIEAEDYTRRHEGALRVTTIVSTVGSERETFGRYDEAEPIDVRAAFVIVVDDCNDATELYRRVLTEAVIPTLVHEVREFFRIKPTGWAPFHPHKRDGVSRWGQPEVDRKYGVA
jgi:hypothetical protein